MENMGVALLGEAIGGSSSGCRLTVAKPPLRRARIVTHN
jgi:hypothetical protein